ncbi:YncE family protein [Adhaeribacter aquaticus]|uniref:YncE family protein n=1 Tax=Adhaeribacter aquaticus TaxID=299567 RepID=UPI0006845158|nr:YncE family protein [Adhaeribacter aquaticus]
MKKQSFLTRILLGGFLLANTFLFTSCEKNTEGPKGSYEKGVFVVNEGAFGKGNGAISFYNPSSKATETDIFYSVNNRPLGDVVQSMTIFNEKAYVVVNNSNKIEITDANTFKSVGSIEGLKLPRYFTVANNKGYVTEWVAFSGNGRVSVINLANNTVTKTIEVGALPERLVVVNNKLYVTNSNSNTVSVINTATDVVETTITVGDSPNSLAVDANNKIWVLAGGKTAYNSDWSVDVAASTAGSLSRINTSTNAVEATLPFATKTGSPNSLTSNKEKNKFYYKAAGKVYQLDITATSLPTTAFINRNFYGLGVDPNTNIIYGALAGSFTADSKAIRYNTNGTAIDSFATAIGPNGFIFK